MILKIFPRAGPGRADLSSKFSRAGPGRLDLKILLGRADSGRKFFRAGPTRSQNSPGPGRRFQTLVSCVLSVTKTILRNSKSNTSERAYSQAPDRLGNKPESGTDGTWWNAENFIAKYHTVLGVYRGQIFFSKMSKCPLLAPRGL